MYLIKWHAYYIPLIKCENVRGEKFRRMFLNSVGITKKRIFGNLYKNGRKTSKNHTRDK